MCGISGQLYFSDSRQVDEKRLRQMNGVIRHRGPDSDGFYFNQNVGLAMTRLAVIDLERGKQPLSNEDGSIWVVFNGEIYNYRELKKELESQGHVFKSNCDTEVWVHLYEQHGVDCVNFVRGMFAVALWDQKRQKLMLARDRMGQKPLYYAEHEESLLFGSEIKSLLQYPGFPREVNRQALDHYLTLQYIPDPLTGFKSIFKLPAAHRLVFEKGRKTLERYWDYTYEPKHSLSEGDLESEFLKRLRDSVRMRLVSDVPLGVHLSGGIDSSVITALASQESSQPVKTFSIGFKEESFSELPYAREVSQKYATDHHEFVVTYENLPELMQQLVGFFDEPFADPAAVPLFYLSKLTREHVTVALNGDGGDELFGGYPRHGLDGVGDAYAKLPTFVTQSLVPSILSYLPQPMDRPGERNWMAGLKRLQQAVQISSKANMVRWGSYFNEPMKRTLWRENNQMEETASLLSQVYDQAQATGHLDKTLYVDSQMYLPGDLLVKADRMTMAHSLEARSPFLDHELVAWVAKLPEVFKRSGKNHKVLLKSACRDLLPTKIQSRGKQGFGIPTGAWFRGPLKKWSRDVLLDSNAKLQAYFQTKAVENLLNEHLQGRTNHGNRIWALIMLELWLKTYVR